MDNNILVRLLVHGCLDIHNMTEDSIDHSVKVRFELTSENAKEMLPNFVGIYWLRLLDFMLERFDDIESAAKLVERAQKRITIARDPTALHNLGEKLGISFRHNQE